MAVRQKLLDALNGGAANIDPAVLRALFTLVSEHEEHETVLKHVREELAAAKQRTAAFATSAALSILVAAVLAALRLG